VNCQKEKRRREEVANAEEALHFSCSKKNKKVTKHSTRGVRPE
jgi:hypothetical protein